MFLAVLSYIGILVGFVFLTLAIGTVHLDSEFSSAFFINSRLIGMIVAAGLYYLSELVEEHSRFTKRLLEKLILGIVVIHILLLLFDHFPFWLTVFSIATQFVYYQNLKQFPFIQLSSSTFIASCGKILFFFFLHS